MATVLQVRCINRTTRTKPHERIRNVGGVAADGSPWKISETQAIADIDSGRYAFFMEAPVGHRVDVVVASRLGREVP